MRGLPVCLNPTGTSRPGRMAHSPAAGVEAAAGAANPGAVETATAPPAGTLASLPIPTKQRGEAKEANRHWSEGHFT